MENWKDIKGYEGYYQISNMGRVKSMTRTIVYKKGLRRIEGRMLKSNIAPNGYKYVMLSKYGVEKTKYIHRLVATEFIPNINAEREIDHVDENKTNNIVDNLRWVSRFFNASRSTKGRYRRKSAFGENNSNAKKVYCLKNGKIINVFNCAKYLANELNMNYSTLKKKLQNDNLIVGDIKYSYSEI